MKPLAVKVDVLTLGHRVRNFKNDSEKLSRDIRKAIDDSISSMSEDDDRNEFCLTLNSLIVNIILLMRDCPDEYVEMLNNDMMKGMIALDNARISMSIESLRKKQQ